MKIIDVHIHPHHVPQLFPDHTLPLNDPAGRADTLVKLMDATGVAVSGILGRVPPFQSEREVREGNDFTVAMVRARPDRFYGMCFINPLHSPSFVAGELDRVLSQPEIRGIKLEIDVNCRDFRLDLVMSKAREYRAVVLQHCWYLSFWNDTSGEGRYRQQGRSEPHDVADLARRFPDVPIIMAHLDGCGVRGVLDVKDCPNVRIDTSGGQPFSGIVEYAVRHLGAERLLFGSDRPGARGFESQLARVQGAAISEEARRKIFSENAINLFRLNEFAAIA